MQLGPRKQNRRQSVATTNQSPARHDHSRHTTLAALIDRLCRSSQPPLPLIQVTPASLELSRSNLVRNLTTLGLYIGYLAVGILFYQSVESTAKGKWTTLDAIYFAHVTMSTVGYGDLTPSSSGSQLFTLVYIVFGVVVIFTRISGLVTAFTQPVFNHCRELLERLFPQETIDSAAPTGFERMRPAGLRCRRVASHSRSNRAHVFPLSVNGEEDGDVM